MKPRRQVYTMDMYLKKMKDKDIRTDSDVQRLTGQWNTEQTNELIMTVLTDDYIPPIIIGEEANSQLWIIDGLQRSSSLMRFRYGNYKVTSNVSNPILTYRTKKKDENNNIVLDDKNNIVWEDCTFDIKNKRFSQLPVELQKKFDEYQIETVIHENCSDHRIATLIKRYNNHTAMNNSQKAFTYIDNYARRIRAILDSPFFINCGKYTERDRTKGVMERMILESMMCIFHMDEWNKNTKKMAMYLNENATDSEFDFMEVMIDDLAEVMTEETNEFFNIKNSFIWFAICAQFIKQGYSTEDFVNFLGLFKIQYQYIPVNGVMYETLDEDRNTKDKSLILAKIDFVNALIKDFISNEKIEKNINTKENIAYGLFNEINQERIEKETVALIDTSEENSNEIWGSSENKMDDIDDVDNIENTIIKGHSLFGGSEGGSEKECNSLRANEEYNIEGNVVLDSLKLTENGVGMLY